jgi:hypothetical protein
MQTAAAALAGPVDRPQPLDRAWVLAAAIVLLAGGGPLAGPAIRRQDLVVAAPVELVGHLDLPTTGTAFDRGHAADPA